MKKDVAKWQSSPEAALSPEMTPKVADELVTPKSESVRLSSEWLDHDRSGSFDKIPILDSKTDGSTTIDEINADNIRERRQPANL